MIIISHIGAVKSRLSYPMLYPVDEALSNKANCMCSNLTHYNENLKAKNSEWPKRESVRKLLNVNGHNSHRQITITVAIRVDFIWNRNSRSRKLSPNFFVLILTLYYKWFQNYFSKYGIIKSKTSFPWKQLKITTFFTGNLYRGKGRMKRKTAEISLRGGFHCVAFWCNNKKKWIFVFFLTSKRARHSIYDEHYPCQRGLL